MIRQKDIFIYEKETVKDALKKLDNTANKVLLVISSDDTLLGTITDGDIRRYILRGKSLENDIREIYNRQPTYIRRKEFTVDAVKDMSLKNKIELIPIIDESHKIVDFITWNEVFSEQAPKQSIEDKLSVPVVIMAGGKGERLEPFSKIFPKPLIPINDKPIVEIIIDEFKKQGIREYYLTLNHKGDMIESYFHSIEKDYRVEFVRENDFLGTAGSLQLLSDRISDTFIVSNCDVIVKARFKEVLDFHKEHKSSLTVLSAIQHHKIPYGVIKFKEGGEVVNILEKPEYTFTVNAGVYVLDKSALKFIPEGACYDMTELIAGLVKNNQKVLTYPVNENDYIDIGQWGEYKKAMEKLQTLI